MTGRFAPTGKSVTIFDLALSSPFCKNISVFPKRKSGYIPGRPAPRKGRIMIVAYAGRDAVDAEGAADEGA